MFGATPRGVGVDRRRRAGGDGRPVAAAPVSTVSPAVKLSADSTALLVCGTGCPTFHDADVEIIMNQFITPTHPGQTHHAGRGDHARGSVAPNRGSTPSRARGRGSAPLRTWWRRVAG